MVVFVYYVTQVTDGRHSEYNQGLISITKQVMQKNIDINNEKKLIRTIYEVIQQCNTLTLLLTPQGFRAVCHTIKGKKMHSIKNDSKLYNE